MKTIKNLKSKIMRIAWELFRNTNYSFSECLKNAWNIIKQSFNRIDLKIGRCFLENKKNVFRMIDKSSKDINKEMVSNIVFLVNHFKRDFELTERKILVEKQNAEIRENNHPIIADHLINGYSLD